METYTGVILHKVQFRLPVRYFDCITRAKSIILSFTQFVLYQQLSNSILNWRKSRKRRRMWQNIDKEDAWL